MGWSDANAENCLGGSGMGRTAPMTQECTKRTLKHRWILALMVRVNLKCRSVRKKALSALIFKSELYETEIHTPIWSGFKKMYHHVS
jgi:hypothetical protein